MQPKPPIKPVSDTPPPPPPPPPQQIPPQPHVIVVGSPIVSPAQIYPENYGLPPLGILPNPLYPFPPPYPYGYAPYGYPYPRPPITIYPY